MTDPKILPSQAQSNPDTESDSGHYENFEYEDYDAYTIEEDLAPPDWDGFCPHQYMANRETT